MNNSQVLFYTLMVLYYCHSPSMNTNIILLLLVKNMKICFINILFCPIKSKLMCFNFKNKDFI